MLHHSSAKGDLRRGSFSKGLEKPPAPGEGGREGKTEG